MRIGIDIQSTVGSKTGIGRYTEQLLAALRRCAPEHEIVPLSWGRDVPMRLDRRLRWQQAALPRQARQSHLDILHIPGFDAPRRKPCPVVFTVHDLIGVLYPGNFPPVSRFYWQRWLPHSLRWADHIIADSEATRRDIIRLVSIPSSRITVIPLGVGAEFHPVDVESELDALRAMRRKYALPARFIVYLGTLEPRKGLDTLLTAYAILANEVDVVLVIAGKVGWYAESLIAQVERLGLRQRVHFTGYLPDAEVPGMLSLASVFVLPSRYEGFGLPPLEAMACGVPVVCSNASSLPEVVGDAGLLVPPDDPPALAAAIHRVLADEGLRDSLRARGLERARQFTWEQTASRTLAVYQELAG